MDFCILKFVKLLINPQKIVLGAHLRQRYIGIDAPSGIDEIIIIIEKKNVSQCLPG